MQINHQERAHSPWGASSASRWMACPASIKLSEGMPDESSEYAAEGTCAHELAEKALLDGKPCREYVGEIFNGHEVDEEMAMYVQIYVDYINQQASQDFKDVTIEERFNLNHIEEGLYGTNDACISEFMGTLEIVDLKYGKGVSVYPEENKQLLYYALGALKGGEYSDVKLTIIQPRVEDPIKSWKCSVSRLEDFGYELKAAVARTKQENPKMATGDHCRFCKAKAICPKMKEELQVAAQVIFDAPIEESNSLVVPEKLSFLDLSAVLDNADDIRRWLDSVEAYAHHELSLGHQVLHYKLVAKRSNRKYVDEKLVVAEFERTFGDKIYDKKLKGIPAMEKLVGKELIKDFVYTPEAGTTIASIGDKRPEVKPRNIELFERAEIEQKSDDFETLTF